MLMCAKMVYSVLFIVLYYCVATQPEVLIEESSVIESVQGPTGGTAELPCDVTPALHGDRMGLVIWYKQGHDAPIYSFDIREGVTSHWSDPSILAARATFRGDTKPAVLILSKLRPDDSGQYRCRVDFIKSPTKNIRLNLTVLVPPERLIIVNQEGIEVQNGVLGPYDEGSEVNLTCIAVGGRPRARVSWWRSHALLAKSEARATVTFTLQRSDHSATITCQAVTDPSMSPISESISINIILPVLSVRLGGGSRPLVAGKTVDLVCQAVGARPQPKISWWKDGTRLEGARTSMSADGNVTSSTLTFVPSLDDAGRVISCRAVQPALPHRTLEDGWKMVIQHVPLVRVSLGANLISDNVVEHSDVYLDCTVRANPPHSGLYFTHNGVIIKTGDGVLLANQSLVLQGVSRRAAGDYRCVARNSLGEGISDALNLNVKYTPRCKHSKHPVLRAAIGELIDIDCELDANPQELMTYEWWFNSSSHGKLKLSGATLSTPQNNKLRVYGYTVNSSTDYGWLQCSGTNSVGRQQAPCLFQILPANKPSPVKDCEIRNVTYDSLCVNCSPGHDGGLPQTFLLQITDMSTSALLCNMSEVAPRFFARGLRSSNSISVRVVAYNKLGASEPITITANLLNNPQNYAASVQAEMPWMLKVAAASIAALVALAAVPVAVCYWKTKRKSNGKADKVLAQQDKTSNMSMSGNKEAESVDSLDKNPDIIPLKSKTNESCSNESSITDYSSIRNLIPDRNKYDLAPNCERYYDPNIDCNQYIQGRPMEYRARPTYQTMPNIGPYIQNIGPIPRFGLNNVDNDRHRQSDTVIEDWLIHRNALPLNTNGLIPLEQLMPPEIYPPPPLYCNPRPLQRPHMQDLEHRLDIERSVDHRSVSSSPLVRFQDNRVYFNKSIDNKTDNLLAHSD